ADSRAPSPPESLHKKSPPFPRGRCCWAHFSPAIRSCRRYPCSRPLPWNCWHHAPADSSQTGLRSRTALEYPETQKRTHPRTCESSDKVLGCIPCLRRKSHKGCAPEKSATPPWHSSA